jgi:DNA-binding transcriptional LysR family regulator
MELLDLRVFRTVVRAGGMTKAAEQLHRVPSNISVRIRNLEDELGVALFERQGRQLLLSAAGSTLLGYADRLLTLAEEAREAVAQEKPRGVLRLGAMESTAAARLPGPLNLLVDRYPEITIELRIGDPRSLLTQLHEAELDAALVTGPVDDERLATQVAFTEELVIVADRGHPPISTPEQVGHRPILAFHLGCPHRQRLEAWFARGGVMPERVIELGSYHAMLGCAVVGMGIALMPRVVLDTYTERGRLSVHPLGDGFHSADTLLVWRKAARQPKVAALAAVLAETRTAGCTQDPDRQLSAA